MKDKIKIKILEAQRDFLEWLLGEGDPYPEFIHALEQTIQYMSFLIRHLVNRTNPPVSTPVDIRDHTGMEVSQIRGAFFDVDGFDNMTGSGDYTFIAWFDFAGPNVVLYGQGSSLLTSHADRFTIMSNRIYSGATTDTYSTANGLGGIVVTRTSGVTKATYTGIGGVATKTLTTLPNVAAPGLKMFGSEYQTSPTLNTVGDTILAIQYLDTAISDAEAVTLLEDFTLHLTPTDEFLFYEKTDGATDNGAYPAIMSNYSVPSPYVVSASFVSGTEHPWRAFDQNYNTRTILKNAAGTASAGAWLKIDLGSGNEQACDEYIFRSWASQGANSFTVAGSNDDAAWTDLYTGTGLSTNTTLQKHTWTNSTTYRYYRITVNSGFNSGQWTSYFHLLIDQSKEWTTGGGYGVDKVYTFPV